MKNRFYIAIICMLTWGGILQAQQYQMDVELNDGSIVSYILAKVQDVNYDEGRTIINMRGKNTYTAIVYNNTDIQSISWSEYKGLLSPTGANTHRMDEQHTAVVTPEYAVAFDINVLSEEKTLTVQRTATPSDLFEDGEGIARAACYNFDLEGQHELNGIVELRIPMYIGYGRIPLAAYKNQTTGEWEPVNFYYDQAAQEIVIKTNHLSEYGAFSVDKSHTRTAKLKYHWLPFIPSKEYRYMASKLIDVIYSDNPEVKAIETWGGQYGDCTQLGLDVGFQALQSLGFGSDALEEFAGVLGHVGTAVSVYQIMRNDYQGNDAQVAGQALKVCLNQALGWTTYYCGTAILSASMAAIAFFDYALNKFAEQAWTLRKDIYRKAFELYYQKGHPGYRSGKEWFDIMYPIMKRKDLTKEELQAAIDKEVHDYAWKFWEDEAVVAEYITEAHDNFGFSYGGGLNNSIKSELSEELRGNLYNGKLTSVFMAVKNHIEEDLWEEADKQMEEYCKQLNKYAMLTFHDTGTKDDKSEYDGCTVRFKNIPDSIDATQWSLKLNEKGEGSLIFRIYAMHDSHLTNQMEILNKDGESIIDFELHDLRAGYNKDAAENWIDLNDFDISGQNFEDSYEITLDSAFRYIGGLKTTYTYAETGYTDETCLCQPEVGLLFADWNEGIIDVMKAHKYVKPNSSGVIDDNSMGMEIKGNFDSQTNTGSGTWKLQWTTHKTLISDAQLADAMAVPMTFNEKILPCLKTQIYVTGDRDQYYGMNQLLQGDITHDVQGTFTVRLEKGEYIYQFEGTGTYLLDGKALTKIKYWNIESVVIETPGEETESGNDVIRTYVVIHSMACDTPPITAKGKVDVKYQFMVTD